MGIVFILCIVIAVITSLLTSQQKQDKDKNESHAVNLQEISFTTSSSFNIAAISLITIISALYVTWW